jgi:hypothetical protein
LAGGLDHGGEDGCGRRRPDNVDLGTPGDADPDRRG